MSQKCKGFKNHKFPEFVGMLFIYVSSMTESLFMQMMDNTDTLTEEYSS